MRILSNILFFTFLSMIAAKVSAEVAIITHPDVDITLDRQQAKKIFMGKTKNLPGSSDLVVVIAQDKLEKITKIFNKKVLKQRDSQLEAYWSRVVFTGKGHPPQELENDAAVIEFILANPRAIGYINTSSLTDAVKVVLELP